MLRRDFCGWLSTAAVLGAYGSGAALARAGSDPAVRADVAAKTMDGPDVLLPRAEVGELRGSMLGPLLLPSDEDYDSSRRLWNGMFDRRPAMIALCRSEQDVARAVEFAAHHRLLLAVRGGGHSYPGKSSCDGGMMINLALMNAVAVDVDNRSARAGGGALLGQLDGATLPHSLATTTGIVSHTGVGGFTLGGGMGYTDRRFGLAVDNLAGATLVTADGKVRDVSAEESPDLFWGIRGGGGNFGVVTTFEYRLHTFNPTIINARITWPFAQARELLEFYAEYSAAAADELNIEPGMWVDGDGERWIYVHAVFSGDLSDGDRQLEPLISFGKPVSSSVEARDYRVIQTAADDYFAHGTLNYLKSGFLNDLSSDAIRTMVEVYEGEFLPDMWFQHLGGAITRVDADATAFHRRDMRYNFGISSTWNDPAENDVRIASVRRVYDVLSPWMSGFYTNLNNEENASDTEANFSQNYARLVEIKRRHDPNNLFRLNSNIDPRA